MRGSFKSTVVALCVFFCLSRTLTEGKKVANMETFTFDVYKDVQAVNIHQLKEETGLRKHVKTINLPDIDFDPKREKTAKKIFKLISFEFADSDDDEDAIPELGLSTFRITSLITRADKSQCNKTLNGDPSDCPPVTRKTNVEFFAVPFDASKRFHRTYGQLNAGFNDQGSPEDYLIYHSEQTDTAVFDFPDREYPKLGVKADAHIDLYNADAYRWFPRCNREENRKECIKFATCGAKIPGGGTVEKDANFCCLCVPGTISNAFPTPCGVNITERYETFLSGNLGCGDKMETCPYNPNPMKDVKCRKTFGTCPMTCKCGSPHAMEPCIHPFTRKAKYPLFKELKQKTSNAGGTGKPANSAPDGVGIGIGVGIGVIFANALLAAILC